MKCSVIQTDSSLCVREDQIHTEVLEKAFCCVFTAGAQRGGNDQMIR